MTAPRVKEHNFLSHTWLKQPEDHLILGTETGQLLMFRSGDFVCYLVGAPGGQTKITALLSYSQVLGTCRLTRLASFVISRFMV